MGKELRSMMPWLKAPLERPVAKPQVPVVQRAQETGVPSYVIRRLVREGKIPGTKIGGRVYIPPDIEIPYRGRKIKS